MQAAQYFHERPRCKGGAAKGLQSPPGGAEQGAKAKSGEQDSAASSPKKRNRPSKKQAALKPEEPVAKGIEGPFGVSQTFDAFLSHYRICKTACCPVGRINRVRSIQSRRCVSSPCGRLFFVVTS